MVLDGRWIRVLHAKWSRLSSLTLQTLRNRFVCLPARASSYWPAIAQADGSACMAPPPQVYCSAISLG